MRYRSAAKQVPPAKQVRNDDKELMWSTAPNIWCTYRKLDFGQNLNGLAIVRGAKHGVHQFLYGHGQAETVRKIAVVSFYPANALSSALSKLAKVEVRLIG